MDCSICLEIIEENPVNFCCKQNYHFHCIKKWTDKKLTCPICRKLLDKKVLNIIRNIQNNINELKRREKNAHHIIETLLMDIELVKQRTKNNIEKISNISNYTHPEIPSSPRIRSNSPLNFSNLLTRRGVIALPFINTNNDCGYPAFCRCMHCAPNISPGWN